MKKYFVNKNSTVNLFRKFQFFVWWFEFNQATADFSTIWCLQLLKKKNAHAEVKSSRHISLTDNIQNIACPSHIPSYTNNAKYWCLCVVSYYALEIRTDHNVCWWSLLRRIHSYQIVDTFVRNRTFGGKSYSNRNQAETTIVWDSVELINKGGNMSDNSKESSKPSTPQHSISSHQEDIIKVSIGRLAGIAHAPPIFISSDFVYGYFVFQLTYIYIRFVFIRLSPNNGGWMNPVAKLARLFQTMLCYTLWSSTAITTV